MPTPSQLVAMPLVAGVDRRAHAERVQPPKLLLCDDATFEGGADNGTWPGDGLQRRAGYTSLNAGFSAPTAKGLFSARGQIGMEDSLYTRVWDAASASWLNRGPAPTAALAYEQSIGVGLAGAVDAWYDGSGAIFAIATSSTNIDVYRRPTDGPAVNLGSVTSGLRARVLRETATGNCVIIYADSSNNLKLATIGASSLGAPTTLSTDCYFSSSLGYFDAVTDGATIFYAFQSQASATSLKYVTCNFAGTTAHSGTETIANRAKAVCAAIDSSGTNCAIAWTDLTASDVRGRIFTVSALGAVTAQTQILAGSGSPSFAAMFAGACFSSATLLHVVWGIGSNMTSQTGAGTLSTAAAVTATQAIWNGAQPFSAPFSVWSSGDLPYLVLGHYGDGQGGGFLARLPGTAGKPTILGRFFGNLLGEAIGNSATVHPASGSSSYVWRFPAVVTDSTVNETTFTWPVTFDFSAVSRWVDAGAASYASGVGPWRLDDDAMVESGFYLYLAGTNGVGLTCTPSNGAGALTNSGTYGVMVIPEWAGAGGEREQGTGIPTTVTMGAADDTITVTLDANKSAYSLTNKRSDGSGGRVMTLGVYRTTNGGTIYYREGAVDAGTASYTITTSDASIISHDTLYFVPGLAGSELDNIPPPTPSVIASGNSRVVTAGGPSAETIYVGKYQDILEPLAFNDALLAAVDRGSGPITAAAYLGDMLVVFRDDRIYYVSGEGPDNTGLNGEFSDGRTISENVGCSDQRTLIRVPQGLMWFDDTSKMIWLLGADLQLAPIGADVVGYLRDNASSDKVTPIWATHDVRAREVRFGDASRQLVYNYERQAWYRWRYGGLSAVQIGTKQYLLTSAAGAVTYYDPAQAQYQDPSAASITLSLRSPWISIAGAQGHERLRKVLMAFDRQSGFLATIKIRYDGSETVTDTFTRSPVSGDRQIEARPSKQRCRSVSVQVDVSGTSTLSPVLHEIAFELTTEAVGAKPTDPAKRAT